MIEICASDSLQGILKLGLNKTNKEILPFFSDLNMGPIDENNFLETRKRWICSYFTDGSKVFKRYKKSLEEITKLAKSGAEFRFWLSNNPRTRCAFYCFVSLLQNSPCKIFIIEKPDGIGYRPADYESSWEEFDPFDIPQYLHLTRELTQEERNNISQRWKELQKESTELRINLDKDLKSVSIDYFDEEILSYIPKTDTSMANVVGHILGRSKYYFSDSFITDRIYSLIDQGKLILVLPSSERNRSYRGAIIRKA